MHGLSREEVLSFCEDLRVDTLDEYTNCLALSHSAMGLVANRFQVSGVSVWEFMRKMWEHAGKMPFVGPDTPLMVFQTQSLHVLIEFAKGWTACPPLRLCTVKDVLASSGCTIEKFIELHSRPFDPRKHWLLWVQLADASLCIETSAVFMMKGVDQARLRLEFALARENVRDIFEATESTQKPNFEEDTAYDFRRDLQFCVCGQPSRMMCSSCHITPYCSRWCMMSDSNIHDSICGQVAP